MRRLIAACSLVVMVVVAAAAIAAPLPKGLWQGLLKPGSKWTLPFVGDKHDESPDQVVVEVAEVRKVGAVDVLRLQVSFVAKGKAEEHDAAYVPAQVAINKKGIYTFDGEASDAAITKALKKKPTFSDPTKPSKIYRRPDGTFSWAPKEKKGAVCYGFGADDESCGAAPCFSWICLDPTGVIGIGGLDENGAQFGFSPAIPGYGPS